MICGIQIQNIRREAEKTHETESSRLRSSLPVLLGVTSINTEHPNSAENFNLESCPWRTEIHIIAHFLVTAQLNNIWF